LRSGGILALKLIKIPNVRQSTIADKNSVSRHIAKPMLAVVLFFLKLF